MKLTYGKLRQIIMEEIHRINESMGEETLLDIVNRAVGDFNELEPGMQDVILNMAENMFEIFKLEKERSFDVVDSHHPNAWPPQKMTVSRSYKSEFGNIEDHEYFDNIYNVMMSMDPSIFDMNY